jgi:uncharacterized protein
MDQELLLLSMLDTGLAHCTVVIQNNGGLLFSLFMAGLLGSTTHCLSMCAPFVLSQVTARLETIPLDKMSEFRRLSGAALLPYHFGRMTTYVVLGISAGLLAQGLIEFSGMKWISAALLILASLFFLGYALKRLGINFPNLVFWGAGQNKEVFFAKILSSFLKPFFAQPIGLNGYFLGLGLGFLPCGLLYGALAAAGSSGDSLTAAIGMVFFTFGTIPSLIIVGFAGHMASRKWRSVISDLAPILLIINSGVLAYLAYALIF